MAEELTASGPVLKLTEEDIPGAKLEEPMERYTIPELKWWLLCRGISLPTSLRKQQLLERYYIYNYKL